MKSKLRYFIFLSSIYSLYQLTKLFINKFHSFDRPLQKKHQFLYAIWNKFDTKKQGNEIRVEYKNNPIFLRPSSSDLAVFNQVMVNEEYEVLASLALDTFGTTKVKTIVDLGGNIGLTSVFLANRFPTAQIISVEPDTHNFKYLTKNCAPYRNIKALNAAVWSSEKQLTIDSNFRDGAEWSRSVMSNSESSTTNQLIDAITIKKIMETTDTDNIDILKMDIEGAEAELFLNDPVFPDIMKKTKVLAVEVHEEFISKDKVRGILTNAGFSITVSGESLVGCKS
jgi:FkbM family methyltransferase